MVRALHQKGIIRVKMQAAEPYATSGPSIQATHTLRVFLVEDSPVLREHLTEALSSLNLVEVAGHAETEAAAIANLKAESFDAVVLDLQLKEGHGFNVLKAMRAHPDTARIAVLILTNHATPQYRARSIALGADYFFDKSREYDRLCETLVDLATTKTELS
jgi:DNA-binding NarL/FixJ family response regulator